MEHEPHNEGLQLTSAFNPAYQALATEARVIRFPGNSTEATTTEASLTSSLWLRRALSLAVRPGRFARRLPVRVGSSHPALQTRVGWLNDDGWIASGDVHGNTHSARHDDARHRGRLASRLRGCAEVVGTWLHGSSLVWGIQLWRDVALVVELVETLLADGPSAAPRPVERATALTA